MLGRLKEAVTKRKKEKEDKGFKGSSLEDGSLANAQNLKAHESFVQEKKTNSLMGSI